MQDYKLQDIYFIYVSLYILTNFRYPFPNKKNKSNNDETNYIYSNSIYDDINYILNSFIDTYLLDYKHEDSLRIGIYDTPISTCAENDQKVIMYLTANKLLKFIKKTYLINV